MEYNYAEIEKKWQKYWVEHKSGRAVTGSDKPKFYGLIEFPYPSGQGLHVGHTRPFTAMDVICRRKRMQGYNVLFPIGYDAFGLPTENYAIKNHVHPSIVTKQNIANFEKQLHMLGYSFDWDRVVDTTDPEYYKWTQWIFLRMYKKGLAYKASMPVNWCTSCKCVLANEEVVDGVCERCGSPVVRREKSQWMLAITKYADRLIDDLDDVDFIPRVKTQQRNWIGRSEGAELTFGTTLGDSLTVYTTRCDTLFGVTYMVLSPEHPILDTWKDKLTNWDAVAAYREEAVHKSDFERSELNKDKTGVRLEGVCAVNPATKEEIPIFVSDYVLMSYGTGAVMGVPGHDQRDWEFATKFGLPIIEVVQGGDITKEAFTLKDDTGIMVNSGFLNGMTVKDAIPAMKKWHRPSQDELQAARLGILPPALLGRAHPDGKVPDVRLGTAAGGSASAPAPAGRELRADGRRRIAHLQDHRLGQHDLPEVRRRGPARDRHHAAVGGLLVVFPALYGSPQ